MVGRFLILALCVFSAYGLPAPKTISDGVSVVDIINEIEGIVNIHSSPLEARTSTSLTPTQVDNIINVLNQIESIVNIHSARSIGDTGVINWPVVEAVVQGVLSVVKTRSSLTAAQVDNIIEILNKIEGIVNIHSARSIGDTGVINWPVVEYVIEKIESVITGLKTRSSLTPTQVDNIVDLLNQIEGIVNIHSIKPRGVINISGFLDVINQILGSASTRSSLTTAQIENIIKILNEIEGIVNIHSLKVAPEVHLSEGVVNVPVVIDVVNKIEGIVGTLTTRATLSSTDVDNIVDILNQIESIVNIHSSPFKARTALTTSQIESILVLLNKVEGIVNIHSTPVNPRSTTSIIDILNAIENVVQIH